MEKADRVVTWLRSRGGTGSFTEIKDMLEVQHRDLGAEGVLEVLGELSIRRFVGRFGNGLYRLSPQHAAPAASLPSIFVDASAPTTKLSKLLAEIARMGGEVAASELTPRLVAKGIVGKPEDGNSLLQYAFKKGEVLRVSRGRYRLTYGQVPETATPPSPQPEPPADSAPEAPAPAEDEGVEAPLSPDEARLAGLIAAKRERLAALKTEREEYEVVRAHLEDLLASNREAAGQIEQETAQLENLLRVSVLIRTAVALG